MTLTAPPRVPLDGATTPPVPSKKSRRTAASGPATRTLISVVDLRRHRRLYFVVLGLTLTVFALVFLFPLYWMLSGAVKSPAEFARSTPTLIPESFHPGTYVTAWNNMQIAKYFTNTVYYAFGGWIISLLVDVGVAYALSKLKPIFGRIVLGGMLASLMLPPTALLVPAYLTVADLPLVHLNLLNTPWALWLPAAANAFNVYVLKRFFDQIPDDLLDAAAIDGAGKLRQLWSIVLPLSRPVLGVVSIFIIVAMWKDFLWPLVVLQDPDNQTLSVALARLANTSQVPPTEFMAGLAMASLPMIVVFLIFQRSIIGGLSGRLDEGLNMKEVAVATNDPWWRDAVIYQVYPRSFADSDGDGVGDLDGIRSHLGHLAALGVDAIWMSPWYPSPMADAGYDVADFRDIDPVFGTLADAEALIAEAHAAGIRMIVDIVPNHVSSEHVWFQRALADPAAPERELFWFQPPSERMPTDWSGEFDGTTWTRTPDGAWYLHLFTPEQPDLNWDHPKVRAEFEDILRFWLDRGVDGIRIDSAALLFKDRTLPPVVDGQPHPFHDLDEVHDVYRAWRRVADGYDDRALIGEVWMPEVERFANYLRPDELHAAFNFDFLGCAWDARLMRECVDRTLDAHRTVGAPATWVLSNHDVTRHVTRYGRETTTFSFQNNLDGTPVDLELGTRRARAAVLLSLSLPGSAYVYQGEELGLWENENIPVERMQDPMYGRRGHSRDGCRVPMPWSGDEPPFGFSTAEPWLPQPPEWKDRTVQAQTGDPSSMLELYRSAIALRKAEAGLRDPAMAWLDSGPGVLAYTRGPDFAFVLNMSPAAVALPAHQTVLLASSPLENACLPPDTAVWLRLT